MMFAKKSVLYSRNGVAFGPKVCNYWWYSEYACYLDISFEIREPSRHNSDRSASVTHCWTLSTMFESHQCSRCCTRGKSEESFAYPSWLLNPGQRSPEVKKRPLLGLQKGMFWNHSIILINIWHLLFRTRS